MPGRRHALQLWLDDQTRLTLRHWMLRPKSPVGVARRARAVFLLEQGHTYVRTVTWVGLSEYHLRKWAKRFLQQGVTISKREKHTFYAIEWPLKPLDCRDIFRKK